MNNYVFDLGGVLISFGAKKYVEENIKENKEDFFKKIFQSEEWLKCDEGIYSEEDLKIIYSKKYPTQKNEIIKALDNWHYYMEVLENANVIKKLKEKGKSLYILSNLNKNHISFIKKLDFYKYFDGEIFSCNENCVKPQKKIYEILIHRYNLNVSDTIFFDDLKENVYEAKKLGIKGVVANKENMKKLLEEFNLN
ncbi:MAG: HAD family phosphatase [Peptoniphilaceae bacterium]|nr:HAD family phosphatase [Peptoniphilaceae bacterium]MDD7383733.1 HAD family phosphatase [Peptoniphilaceae bacterium]MDY3737867.1 HAD family phosphatase [Peptoniphilaceae bacterium]